MKEMSLSTFIAVFEEMFGFALFWGLVAAATIVASAFLYVMIREHGLRSRRFIWAELAGIAGGFVAILFVQGVTNSGFRDIGGPIDAIVLLGIWVAGALATIMAAYIMQGIALRTTKPSRTKG